VVDVLSTRSSVAPTLRRGIERTRRCPCMNWLFYLSAGSPVAPTRERRQSSARPPAQRSAPGSTGWCFPVTSAQLFAHPSHR
jgi:hypothetical protein